MNTNDIPGLEFDHYTAAQARANRTTVETIHRSAFADAISTGDPFNQPDAFMQRFDAYTDPHAGRFELVVARIDGHPAGQTWGWPLTANSRWWTNLELDSGDRAAFTAENGLRTFALSEIMVCNEFTGQGLAHELHDELLTNRPEERATLLVEPDNTPAYRAYLRWGWHRIGTLKPSWPNAPTLHALTRDLSPHR
ncbi:GNAT family N-acetyltransferase [Streptomyces sp. NPDC059071]|uniref:GNAT family N-acetyltransferase n=1 Tax=Streptomyces sp. NPDC059071 TaxID=3346714 RepID=UPI0036A21CFA